MKRYLVLENGEAFAGLAFGAPCDTVGELVFTTGMNGYIETLTDPSYCGQIVLQTFPLIGNYGIIPADFEGKCCVRGYGPRAAGDDAGALHPPTGGQRAAPRGAHRLRRQAQHRARAL